MPIFSEANSLGSRAPADISAYLSEIEHFEDAAAFAPAQAAGQGFQILKRPYTHTGCVLGHIAAAQTGAKGARPIVGIGQVEGERGLISKRIKITLDKFYICSYPGHGAHQVLCEFAGKSQAAEGAEELKFALRFKAGDGASAAINGAPIFMGVTVGADGICFEGRTVNVSNTLDETVLSTLDSQVFKSGLALLGSAQPALKPLASLASAAVESVLKRKKNVQVHSFNLGLDFSSIATSARLRTGSYLVVQSDDAAGWKWDNFVWNPDALALQYRDDSPRAIPFNYMVFGIAEFT